MLNSYKGSTLASFAPLRELFIPLDDMYVALREWYLDAGGAEGFIDMEVDFTDCAHAGINILDVTAQLKIK